jgi:calpain-15
MVRLGKGGLLEEDDGTKTVGLQVANICLTPFLLCLHAIRIYLIPCVQVYTARCCCWIMCMVFSCGCFKFTDKKFPANESSLGEYDAKVSGNAVTWKRGDEICEGRGNLFYGGIDCKDIVQGQLGDCWLLSAISCLSEFDGAIQQVFTNLERSARGKYQVKLWDGAKKKFQTVTVDDQFPCGADGKPLFTQPNGAELWVMLMEKAFAKFMGSYAALEGGHLLWALHVITGDEVVKFNVSEGGLWERLDMRSKEPTPEKKHDFAFYKTKDAFKEDAFFKLLKKYHKQKCVLGAGTAGIDETQKEGRGAETAGIVPGHAYTILRVTEQFGHKLVNLRNPWGSFEWGGDWSDDSPLWSKHPLVKLAVRPDTKDKDDGAFWMCWSDFLLHFNTVDVCVREVGLKDLALEVHEDLTCAGQSCGMCGVLWGCIAGCLKYWLCCCGCYKLWCTRKSSKTFALDTVTNEGGAPPSADPIVR